VGVEQGHKPTDGVEDAASTGLTPALVAGAAAAGRSPSRVPQPWPSRGDVTIRHGRLARLQPARDGRSHRHDWMSTRFVAVTSRRRGFTSFAPCATMHKDGSYTTETRSEGSEDRTSGVRARVSCAPVPAVCRRLRPRSFASCSLQFARPLRRFASHQCTPRPLAVTSIQNVWRIRQEFGTSSTGSTGTCPTIFSSSEQWSMMWKVLDDWFLRLRGPRADAVPSSAGCIRRET